MLCLLTNNIFESDGSILFNEWLFKLNLLPLVLLALIVFALDLHLAVILLAWLGADLEIIGLMVNAEFGVIPTHFSLLIAVK